MFLHIGGGATGEVLVIAAGWCGMQCGAHTIPYHVLVVCSVLATPREPCVSPSDQLQQLFPHPIPSLTSIHGYFSRYRYFKIFQNDIKIKSQPLFTIHNFHFRTICFLLIQFLVAPVLDDLLQYSWLI